MIRRVRKLMTGALVGIGLLAMAASPATAHTTQGYSGWYVWQGSRAVYAYNGSELVGSAKAETVYRDTVAGRLFGFNAFAQVTDWTNNGTGNCTEVWMDFNGASPHRNPTVLRHCNVGGDVYGEHYYVTDPVLFGQHPAGWDFNVCEAVRSWTGAWDRRNCTNNLGHKPQWPENTSYDGATDAAIFGCVSTYTNSEYTDGCRAFGHEI